MQSEAPLTALEIASFIRSHRLPSSFHRLVSDHYLPLISWVVDRLSTSNTTLLGINGAPGTGKSTLAEFLQLGLASVHDKCVAVLSIDDFYLTKAERRNLAQETHPLLATRGVPGTHDIRMLLDCLNSLSELGKNERYRLPRFDKAQDDRVTAANWPRVSGPIDLIILEGWCVGSVAQDDSELDISVNKLEHNQDPDGKWRKYVNNRLKTDYAQLSSELEALVFLKAPNFETVYAWRLEQEQKLAATAPANAAGTMDDCAIAEFIQFYERIVHNDFTMLPKLADVVLELDDHHNCITSRYCE